MMQVNLNLTDSLNFYIKIIIKEAIFLTLHELERILEEIDLGIHFQPIFDLSSEQIIGYEALTRCPAGSCFQNPLQLFAAAEKHGKLYELDRITRTLAMELFSASQFRNLLLFVNIDPRVVTQSQFTSGWTREKLARLGLQAEQVVFEITERSCIEDFHAFKQAINHYRRQGYRIAIDDVGSGFSSLQAIAELHPDIIKIDRSIVAGAPDDYIKQAILESMTVLGHRIGIALLAEGIETGAEQSLVQQLGYDLGQGYLLGRPPPLPQEKNNPRPKRTGVKPDTSQPVQPAAGAC